MILVQGGEICTAHVISPMLVDFLCEEPKTGHPVWFTSGNFQSVNHMLGFAKRPIQNGLWIWPTYTAYSEPLPNTVYAKYFWQVILEVGIFVILRWDGGGGGPKSAFCDVFIPLS